MRERLARGDINQDEFNRLKTQAAAPADEDAGPLKWLKGDRALETARLRLAKGEITPDEYATIRQALSN